MPVGPPKLQAMREAGLELFDRPAQDLLRLLAFQLRTEPHKRLLVVGFLALATWPPGQVDKVNPISQESRSFRILSSNVSVNRVVWVKRKAPDVPLPGGR